MDFSFGQWLLAVAGALMVGLAKTGLPGLGILCVVVFASILPAKESSGFILPMLIFADSVAVAAYWRHTQWRHLLRLFPWTGAGVLVGWWAMERISDAQAQVMIGGIVLALLGMQLWRRWREKEARVTSMKVGGEEIALPGIWFAPLLGVLAGFTTLVSNAAGPLMSIYLLAMGMPKMKFIGTAAVFFFLLNCFKVPFMVNLGLITTGSFSFNLLLAPAVLTGALLGRWLLPRINQRVFEALVLGLSALAGLRLLLGV